MKAIVDEFFVQLMPIIEQDQVYAYKAWFERLKKAIYATTSPTADIKLRNKLVINEISLLLQKIPHTAGKSLAHLIASHNAIKLLKYIIREKYILQQKDSHGATPMHAAAFAGHLEMMQLLRANGLRLSDQDLDGCRALHAAAKGGHQHVIDFIVAKVRRDRKYFKVLDNNKALMMHHAAEHGHLNLMLHFKKLGIPFDVKDGEGRTALHYACAGGQKAIVAYLLSNSSCRLSDLDNNGCNACHYLAENDHAELLMNLASESMTPNDLSLPCQQMLAPIHYAVITGAANAVSTLAKLGVDVDATCGNGQTSLLLACERADLALVSLLIKLGADKNACDNHGCNAWFYAASSGQEDFLTELEVYDIPLRENHHGCTPMHIAVQTGRVKVVKKLEALGVAINNDNNVLAKQLKALAQCSESLEYIQGDSKREDGVVDIIKYLDTKMNVRRLQYHSTASLELITPIAHEGNRRPLKNTHQTKPFCGTRPHSYVQQLFFNMLPEDKEPKRKRSKVGDDVHQESLPATLPLASLGDEDEADERAFTPI